MNQTEIKETVARVLELDGLATKGLLFVEDWYIVDGTGKTMVDFGWTNSDEDNANAKQFVYYRTAAPALAREVERLQVDLNRAHEALDERDELRERVERLTAALKAQTGWQPIETAPKDGTKLQGWNVDGWIPRIRFHSDRTGWQYAEGNTWWTFSEYRQPTHWQPLPQPPTL